MRRVASTLLVVLCFVALLPAESAKSLHAKGVKAEARQDYEAAYEYYKAAYNQKPEELKFRVSFERSRFLASSVKVHKGQRLRDMGRLQDALTLFQQAAEIDGSNDLAAQEIRRTQQMMQKTAPGTGKGAAKEKDEEDPLRRRLENATAPVELSPFSSQSIDALEIGPEDTKILYETIGKLAGINILFDPDYTSRRLTIRLRKVTLQEALDIVALESRTFWRPVTPNTIFVAQDTQAKRRELEQNVVKTFYLGNVSGPTDLQDIVNAIRTVLEVQRIQQIPSQSAIVIKGTPDQLALAQKMIDDIDKAKPEVIVDVFVLQVRRDKLRDFGLLPPQNASVTLQGNNVASTGTGTGTTGTTGGGLNFNDLQHLNSTNYAVTLDNMKATALFSDSDAKILQSPRIRATDNEKARVSIADKIPIATGSFGTPLGVGTAVGAVGVNTQFTYTDVGVILEITPRVHPDGEVTLKTVMEISNLNGSQTIGGITQPIISQRKVEHTVRLADGEVNLLGGIMEIQETKSTSGAPFLGEIPILKYLFTEEKKERINNEIVFLLVPHIVRGQELSELNRKAFDVGTGSGIDLHVATKQPVRPESAQPAAATVAQPPAATRPAPAPAAPAPVTPRPATTQQPAAPPKPAGTPGQITLKLDPSAATPQAGTTFTLNVTLANGQDISSVLTQISYDARVLQFVSVSNGEFLAKDGQTAALVYRDDPSTGKLQITAQRPVGSTGMSGDGTVFSLLFTAKVKGTGSVSVSAAGARNSQNQPLEVGGSQASVTVN
ncbi:MAG: type II and III secretion system protein [Acidobacteriia bacterium]|nr:type II and III secretion system protein [Terriglobia bacterium]